MCIADFSQGIFFSSKSFLERRPSKESTDMKSIFATVKTSVWTNIKVAIRSTIIGYTLNLTDQGCYVIYIHVHVVKSVGIVTKTDVTYTCIYMYNVD